MNIQYIQTNRKSLKHAGRQAGSQSVKQAGSKTVSQAGRQSGRQAGSQAGRQAGSQVGNQAGSQAVSQAGSQTGCQAGSQPDETFYNCSVHFYGFVKTGLRKFISLSTALIFMVGCTELKNMNMHFSLFHK